MTTGAAAATRSISLVEALRRVTLPGAIHFQRRANVWRLAQRQAALASGVLPLATPRGPLDLVDALLSELNLRGGIALGNLRLARLLRQDFPGTELLLGSDRASEEFAAVFAALDCDRRELAVRAPRRLLRWLEPLRLAAYEMKTRWRAKSAAGGLNGSPERAPVLALPRMPGHLADVLPVAVALQRDHGVETVFGLVDDRLRPAIQDAGFLWTPVAAPPGRAGQPPRDALRRCVAGLGRVFDDPRVGGEEFDAVENAVLAARAKRVLGELARRVVEVAAGAAHLVERLRPQLVLVGNPYTLEGRTASHVARQMGVASAALEHGTIFPNDPIWQECLVDLVCAWGDPSRRALLNCGVAESAAVVTGAPRHDPVFQQVALGQFHAAAHSSILVAASGPGDSVNFIRYQNYINTLYEAADLTPDIQWVVKLHKKDREENYLGVRPQGHPRVKIIRAEYARDGLNIFDHLRTARALVTISSTSALDAMAVDVPVIAVDVWPPGQGLSGVEFLERGCTVRVRTAVELAEAARRAWRGEHDAATLTAARAYAAEHFRHRGSAAAEAARQLARLIEGRRDG
jgi:hypothetical protein